MLREAKICTGMEKWRPSWGRNSFLCCGKEGGASALSMSMKCFWGFFALVNVEKNIVQWHEREQVHSFLVEHESSFRITLIQDGHHSQNGYNSVIFASNELKFGVVEAESYTQHIALALTVRLSPFCKFWHVMWSVIWIYSVNAII